MKKCWFFILFITLLISCKSKHSTGFITFSGTIDNSKDSTLTITGNGLNKIITISKDGSFKDTLKISEASLYSLYSPNSGRGIVFLKNGYHLKLTGNASNFFTSFNYRGNDEGADSNNLFIDRYNFGLTAGSIEGFVMLEKEAFLNKINFFKNGMDSIAALYPNANDSMLEESNIQNNTFFDKLLDNYDQMHARILQQRRTEEKLKKGNKAPDFSNYENYNGNTSSLSDFRGKYVYIDIWATWCRPCIAQFPYLKKLEKEFQYKNISFVSISTDDDRRSNGSWEKARDKWITMVRKRNLSGYQLWAGKDDARFSREYMITSIPRFILIDPEGNLIDSNAKSPADPALRELLVGLPGI
jgi:thiol-disulfide isomerase/thioredoxin